MADTHTSYWEFVKECWGWFGGSLVAFAIGVTIVLATDQPAWALATLAFSPLAGAFVGSFIQGLVYSVKGRL